MSLPSFLLSFHLVSVYHIKFDKTFAEMLKPSNEWKTAIGFAGYMIGLAALFFIWEVLFGKPSPFRGFFKDGHGEIDGSRIFSVYNTPPPHVFVLVGEFCLLKKGTGGPF